MFGQGEDVLPPLSKRRKPERHHGQPMKEIFAKPASGRACLQILARGSDDPDVHRLSACTPQPSNRPVLQHREQLGLEALGEEPDLVEEQ